MWYTWNIKSYFNLKDYIMVLSMKKAASDEGLHCLSLIQQFLTH